MVAYSFDRRFVQQIEFGIKRQTIRAQRRRHARVGERLQLYTGMRTKACRLIRDDVVCIRLDETVLDLRGLADVAMPRNSRELSEAVAGADIVWTVNGMPIVGDERNVWAAADGFAGWRLTPVSTHRNKAVANERLTITPWDAMVLYWMGAHGAGLFEGVMIHWRPVVEQAS